MTVEAPRSTEVRDGSRIAVYSLPSQTPGFENRGIVERRGMTYRAGKRSFALELDTPEIHSVSVTELEALRLPAEEEKKAKVVGPAMGDAQMTDRSLYFSGISESVAVQTNSILELSRYFPRDFQPDYRIVSPRGTGDAALGRDAWIGATDLAAFRMQVFRPPLFLLLIGLLLALAKVAAARASRLTSAQALVAGALEILVAIRLLVGYRVWAMPPHAIEAAELGILAWIALPWIFLAASTSLTPLPRKDRLRGVVTASWLPAMAGLLFSAAFSARLAGGARGVVWVACHLLAAGVAAVRMPFLRAWITGHSRRGLERARSSRKTLTMRIRASRAGTFVAAQLAGETLRARLLFAAVAALATWVLVSRAVQPVTLLVLMALAAAAGWWVFRLARFAAPLGDPELLPFLLAGALFFLVRLVLVLFGWKESIPFSSARVSLSAAYVPAAAILQGIFLFTLHRRMVRTRQLQGRDLAAAVILIVLVWFLPAAVTSDVGLALLNVPVFAFLLAGCVAGSGLAKSAGRSQRLLRAFPALLAVLIVTFVGAAPAWRLVLPLLGKEKFLERAADANFARFIHFAEPERLRELATKQGESLAVTSALLQRYISSGVTGRGYGRSEMSPQLGDTALRDFAPAVFIAAEWGLAGTLAMIALYLAFAAAGRTIAPWRWPATSAPARSPSAAVAYVAATTIAVASIYMILANHELLLLTGKNAYLFGLDSAGDVLETIALLLVIAYGFAAVRPEETVTRSQFPGRNA